jgi:hypothetical protein
MNDSRDSYNHESEKPVKSKAYKSGSHDSKDYDCKNQKNGEPWIVPLPLKTFGYPSTDYSAFVHILKFK